MASLAGCGFEELEQAPSQVTFQAALDLAQALAFGDPPARVDLSFGVVSQATDHDEVNGPVELPIAATVQAMAVYLAGGALDGCHAGEGSEGGF